MAKINRLLIVLFWFVPLLVSGIQPPSVRLKVKQIYDSQVGVREKTGHNDGVQVEGFLAYCGLGKGNPWCASYVCWVFWKAGVPNPRSGYCPDLFTAKNVVYRRSIHTKQKIPESGDIFGLYFPEKGRIAHTGFVDQWGDDYVRTNEGNTNEKGSREGDGVYRKIRPISSIYAVASYIK